MDTTSYVLIFFFYGLAFFSMGLAILLERGHGSNARLRLALAPLAAFGLIHGSHEWLGMFDRLLMLSRGLPRANGWSRYMLAIPAALLAAAGLIAQRREFERTGLGQFGFDCLMAALAFAIYGLIGQAFPRASGVSS